MSRKEQEEVLDWVKNSSQSIALFIEAVGKGDLLDENKLTAYKKSYYDKLFKHKGLTIIKHGRFLWNDPDEKFEHYTQTDSIPVTVNFNRTCYWIVS